jgi:hypothetical protein
MISRIALSCLMSTSVRLFGPEIGGDRDNLNIGPIS